MKTTEQIEPSKPLEGRLLEIVRMSTEDGPGIRTTVFMKGCSLKCAWCHNPESISPLPQLCWIGNRCIGCKTCLSVCPEGALKLSEAGMKIDRLKCTGCGKCADECPGTALELLGKIWQADTLIAELIKDKAYFETSDGGVTISGGDPSMQSKFVAAVLKGLREKGIHTAIDTCGHCSREALDRMLPYSAMVLYDMKLIDPDAHKKLTGYSNERILENLKYVADYMGSHVYPRQLWIRTPIIPDASASHDNIAGIGRWIAGHLKNVVSRWELCAFNNLCRDKYLRLDQKWMFHDAQLLTDLFMEELAQTARRSGVDPEIIVWSGSTQLHNQNLHKEVSGGL